MKKVYLILTLFMTSLFFISINKVSADTIYEVQASYLDYINDDFNSLRDKTIEYCNQNNMFYIMTYENGYYISYIFADGSLEIQLSRDMLNLRKSYSYESFYLSSGVMKPYGSGSFFSKNLWNTAVLLYNNFLDTNMFSIQYTGSTPFTIKYNAITYTVETNSPVPTLYQIYLDSSVPVEPEEPPVIEIETLSNFYFTVIEKINFLATSILSDNVYLSVIGIFLLIFIIKLIFGRYL